MPARGHSAGGAAMLRATVGFDRETFAQLARSAAARELSFSKRARELIELGLETEQQEKAAACSTPATGKKVTSSGSCRS